MPTDTEQAELRKGTPNPIMTEVIEAPKLTYEELLTMHEDQATLFAMRADRDRSHPELDDMTYVEYYDNNRKKDLSYLPPKINKQDVRITSGITREKGSTLLSTMLGFSFEPSITAFDREDLPVNELGQNMSDLVKKSREIENFSDIRGMIYREMIVQGDVFVQDMFVSDFREMPLDEIDWDPERNGISEFSLKTRLTKVFQDCKSRMVVGKKVYLGSTRIPYVQDQDAVAILNVWNRRTMYNLYGTWERWKNIPTSLMMTEPFAFDGKTYKAWNLVPLGNPYQVSEVWLYLPKKNRVQLYLNGVPMLPRNYPLTALCPSGEVPIAQGKLEPISDFAYSKGIPSKTKIDQEVMDEFTKLAVEGVRLSFKPPMGTRSQKVYSPNVLYPGKITNNIAQGDLFPLLQTTGLTPGFFSMYNLVKDGISSKTVSDTYEGEAPKGDPTFGQLQQEKQQAVLKLGHQIDGFVNLEKRMTWNRIHNILRNYTQKYDEHMDGTRAKLYGQYRSFAVDTALESGQTGTRIFRFTKDNYPPLNEHLDEENKLTTLHGKDTRVVYMNPEILRTMKYKWFIQINPTETSSNDTLKQIMFVSNLVQGYNLFGAEAFNQEYAKQRWAINAKEDYNKLFNKMTVPQMMQQGIGSPQVQNIMGKGGQQDINGAGNKMAKPLQPMVG